MTSNKELLDHHGVEGMRRHISHRKKGVRQYRNTFNDQQKLNGVCYYLHDKGHKNAEQQHIIIKLYIIYMEWSDLPSERYIIAACIRIQENFRSFIEWFNNQNPN